MSAIKIDLPSQTSWIEQIASGLGITKAKALQVMSFIQNKIEFDKIVKKNIGTEEKPIWVTFHRKSAPYTEYTNVQISAESLGDKIAQLQAERDALLAEKNAIIAEIQSTVDSISTAEENGE